MYSLRSIHTICSPDHVQVTVHSKSTPLGWYNIIVWLYLDWMDDKCGNSYQFTCNNILASGTKVWESLYWKSCHYQSKPLQQIGFIARLSPLFHNNWFVLFCFSQELSLSLPVDRQVVSERGEALHQYQLDQYTEQRGLYREWWGQVLNRRQVSHHIATF